jgi:hypothetical protein
MLHISHFELGTGQLALSPESAFLLRAGKRLQGGLRTFGCFGDLSVPEGSTTLFHFT